MPPKINHEQRLPRHNIQNKVDFTGRLPGNLATVSFKTLFDRVCNEILIPIQDIKQVCYIAIILLFSAFVLEIYGVNSGGI
jgi:hypothetical protein